MRYRDDATTGGCSPANQEWPNPDDFPDLGDYVLSPTPTPPFVDSSLTAFFYEQSQQRFTLYGDVYPEVVESDEDEAFYNISLAPLVSTQQGMATLTEEVLDEIDAAGWDFSRYDENGDGYIDHIFIILRRTTLPTGWSGFSILGDPTLPVLTYDGLMVDWDLSGSYNRYSEAGNIFPGVNQIRLLAHEIGHDIWTPAVLGGVHIQNVGGANGVPANGTNRVGYALMIGAGSGFDTRGDHTISAFERDLLMDEWIDCPALTMDGIVPLADLYSSNANNCRTVAIPAVGATPARIVYLTNRQRIGVFDDLRTNDCTTPSNDQGLNTTNVLATLAQDTEFAVIAADNTLDRNNQASVYDGDMYGPGTTIQLTPWTRPNVSGYSTYLAGFTMQAGNWQAIDNIRFSGGPNNEMAFDYIEDFRTQPTIREDSWIGDETDGFTFTNDFVVTNTSVLNISTTLGFSSLMRVDAGSEALLDTGANVTVNTGGQMTVLGQVNIFDTLTNNGSIAISGAMNYETTDAIATGATFEVENGADVTFLSSTSITLEPGFHAQPGSNFHALIGAPAPRARLAQAPAQETEAEQVSEHQAEAEASLQQRTGEAQEPLHRTIEAVPAAFSLSANYPNPFNPTTTIAYTLKEDAQVRLVVYNVLGQQVATLVDGVERAGHKSVVWNGRDAAGRPMPSGLYFYRLVADDFMEARTMLLLK